MILTNPTPREQLELHNMAKDGLVEFEAQADGLICRLKRNNQTGGKCDYYLL